MTGQQTARPTAVDYPFGPAIELGLDAAYARVRATQPLQSVRMPYGEDAWLLTRHDDARAVLADPRFSRAMACERGEAMPRVEAESRLPPTALLLTDPPDHTRLRELVPRSLTARRVEESRPRIREIAEGFTLAMADSGPLADVVEHLGFPLPVAVICDALGVPPEDHRLFHRWGRAFMAVSAFPPAYVQAAMKELRTYLGGLIAQRRAEPREDLLSGIVAAADADPCVSEWALVNLASALLVAGHETTVSQISNFVYTLLNTPGAWRRLHADPGLVPCAVEELLRFIPLTTHADSVLYAREDVDLSGGRVRAGEPVLVSMAAANRDPAVFPSPDHLDLERNPNPHLGLGHGIHHCLGASLARLELQEALYALTKHFPDLELALPLEDLAWTQGYITRGLTTLPVRW
ncbi:cytochrome P450 [Streptomonospora nanhaiensis]|uniref:Cytochrome P450 n=1 Tax=Streptomonospora nanhaiensis TaxID=1323731 RepID=A0ABY6YFB0_9ACTN|nr:cytochrome P450 [Streptomonospora nanhaiensis]WAE70915.1 cytochrome P450 [Streptomonospora nanhaiensis]